MLTFAGSVVVSTSWGHCRLSELYRYAGRRAATAEALDASYSALAQVHAEALAAFDAESWEDAEAKAAARNALLAAQAVEMAAAIEAGNEQLAAMLPRAVLFDGSQVDIIDVTTTAPAELTSVILEVPIAASPAAEAQLIDGSFALLTVASTGSIAKKVLADATVEPLPLVISPSSDGEVYTLHLDGGEAGALVGNSNAANLVVR